MNYSYLSSWSHIIIRFVSIKQMADKETATASEEGRN
jgi:hypothetical protein